MMPGSVTSTTKSELETLKTFASLRFKGDRLEPSELTTILGTSPTTAYRKGEVYKHSRGHQARSRTGLWLLSTERHLAAPDLDSHLRYLLAILYPGGAEDKIACLSELMRAQQIEADVSCFWYGKAEAAPPVIGEDIRSMLARLPAKIEADFQTDRSCSRA
jgi:hypothetical protein